jgi:hypothetical protein
MAAIFKRDGAFFERIRYGKMINSQAAMDKAVKSVCDILRRDKAKGARLYVPSDYEL